MTAMEIYLGSDGDATKAFYAELEKAGPIGIVAVNLMRAVKCSTRAKLYRGGIRGRGSYKNMAYDRKQWAMDNLCKVLLAHGESLWINFGWKKDPAQKYHEWVLYCDLPQGQVSFHTASRGAGPDYLNDWDGQHKSPERIIQFCDSVLNVRPADKEVTA